MRHLCIFLILVGCLVLTTDRAQTQSSNVKDLVGGTLIDGYGSTPVRNSVVIVEGERIKAVGQVGTLAIPPGAGVISTEGMSVLPSMRHLDGASTISCHSDHAHGDKTYPPMMESVI